MKQTPDPDVPPTRILLRTIFGLIAMLLIPACSTLTVHMPDEATGPLKQIPDQPEFQQRVVLSGWGETDIGVQDRIGDTTATLHAVRIKNNFFDDLLGVVTFGLWHPVEVEYYLTQKSQSTTDP